MISVIVPCKNRIEKLEECIKSIEEAIKYYKENAIENEYEIIVVNDHSEEGFSEKIKEKFKDVKVLNSDGIGPGHARNYGMNNSKENSCFLQIVIVLLIRLGSMKDIMN